MEDKKKKDFEELNNHFGDIKNLVDGPLSYEQKEDLKDMLSKRMFELISLQLRVHANILKEKFKLSDEDMEKYAEEANKQIKEESEFIKNLDKGI